MENVPFYIPHELEPLIKELLGHGAGALVSAVMSLILSIMLIIPLLIAMPVTVIVVLKRMRKQHWKRRILKGVALFSMLYLASLIFFLVVVKLAIGCVLRPTNVPSEIQPGTPPAADKMDDESMTSNETSAPVQSAGPRR